MDWITDPQIWVSLFALTVLEIVLGIDNIVFISILAGKLPAEAQNKARVIGLMLALITRILLLSLIFWITKLTADLFFVLGEGISWKDLILIGGGVFLIWKSVHEIHGSLEGEEEMDAAKVRAALSAVIAQIVLVDIVFSLDSVITAIALGKNIEVMIAAVVLAMGVMLFASKPIGDYIHRHPTIKMLALSFLLLVGVMLVADGAGHHIERGYIYFAMAFSFAVEMLNIKMRAKGKRKPVDLRATH